MGTSGILATHGHLERQTTIGSSLAIGGGSLEDLVVMRDFWSGRRVFVTGHTGFKGGWLSLWLADMGAIVTGYSLAPPSPQNLFETARVSELIENNITGDVCDNEHLFQALQDAKPEIVLHLAAQSLVRLSYQEPLETFQTNVMGTANLFEAARKTPSVKSVVNVTTDKCYENQEWVWPYRENEPLGGHDPYSSSKACSELVTTSYRKAFMAGEGKQLASARAGNVIGGGDWAADRLIPDFLRAMDDSVPITIRSPEAVRPWQHALEPVSGYLQLAQALIEKPGSFDEAWNFGPSEQDAKPVRWIVDYLVGRFKGPEWLLDQAGQVHEANLLMLSSAKAKQRLGWSPRWNLPTALEKTVDWHLNWRDGSDMQFFTLQQIRDYEGTVGNG